MNDNFIDALRDVLGEQRISIKPITNNPTANIVYDRSISTGNLSTEAFYDESMLDYLLGDLVKEKAKSARKELENAIREQKKKDIDSFIKSIKSVTFDEQNRATIVKWKDGDKTVVVCQEGDEFDKEKGLALALLKHQFGNISYYNTIFKALL